MTSPSQFAERVLTLVVRDPEWRDAVIGDLREEHAKPSARVGAARRLGAWPRDAVGPAGDRHDQHAATGGARRGARRRRPDGCLFAGPPGRPTGSDDRVAGVLNHGTP